MTRFINLMEKNGGRVSYRSNNTDTPEPYEINITLFEAMKESFNKEVNLCMERYICIHTIMLSLEGVPAFYIHSLFGTKNDYVLYKQTNHNRSLNRGKIQISEIDLSKQSDPKSYIFFQLRKLMMIRKKQPAFHPNAVQFTLHLGRNLYGIWRQSLDKKQSIFCISNLTDKEVSLSLLDLNLIGFDHWRDLITEIEIDDMAGEIELRPYQTLWLTNLQD